MLTLRSFLMYAPTPNALVWMLFAMISFGGNAATGSEAISFRRDVAPILLDHCVACHCARKAEGGYRLDAYSEMTKAGDSGAAPLKKAEATQDEVVELVRRLTTEDESERMPAESGPLSDRQIQILGDWIKSGAAFDGKDPEDPLPLVIPPPQHPSPPESYPATVPITAIAFSPDGSKLLTGGYHEILVWSTDGHLQNRISNIGQQTYAMVFAPDGKRLAVASGQPGREGEVRLVDWASGEVQAVLVRTDDVVLDVAFRPDGRMLAAAAADKSIRIVDMDVLEEVHLITSHADWVTAVAWSPDGKRLVSASRDKSAKVFDTESLQLVGSYQDHNAAVRGVALLPGGTEVVSSGSDNKLHRWNLDSAKKVAEMGLGGEGYKVVAGDTWVIVPTSNRTVLQIDTSKNQVLTTFMGQNDWVFSSAVNPDRTLVASGAHNGEINIWQVADGSLVHAWTAKP